MDRLLPVVLVGVGGFIGSVFRYGVSGLLQRLGNGIGFPVGTFTVNILGALLIGLFSELAEMRGAFSPEMRAFLFVGVLGGFTTFSTFVNETLNLWRDGQVVWACVNVCGQVIVGLVAVWLGRMVGQMIWG